MKKNTFYSWSILRVFFFVCLTSTGLTAIAQADNEIQVYASAITQKITLAELHQNYTFKGMDGMPRPKDAHWLEETPLEITHGWR